VQSDCDAENKITVLHKEYASRSLDRREQNYCVTRRELLAVVHFLKYFKQYLLGRHFTVRTDHAALTWLKRTPDPIGQQARWLEVMEEYDYVIEHRPGIRHGNADGMSRKPCTKEECLKFQLGLPADQFQCSNTIRPTETKTSVFSDCVTKHTK